MSQIVIACFVFVAAFAATLHHRRAANIAATELSRLRAAQTGANSAMTDLRSRSNATEKRQTELSHDLTAASAELKAASEVALRARTEPDPTAEGAWPANKPYFYLPKRLLAGITFSGVTPNGEPTPGAIGLLGLTPSERDSVRNAWADFRFALQELQVQSAERMPDTNSITDPNRRSIQFKVPSLTNHLPRLREQLESQLTDAIGSTRTRLLQPTLESHLSYLTNPFNEGDCYITYYAERDSNGSAQHHLRIDAADGSGLSIKSQVGFMRVIQPSPEGQSQAARSTPYRTDQDSLFWHYRHLFGDQPLIPLP